jgi:hypothetical protein
MDVNNNVTRKGVMFVLRYVLGYLLALIMLSGIAAIIFEDKLVVKIAGGIVSLISWRLNRQLWKYRAKQLKGQK